jgi:hypothetical protein
VSSYRKLGLSFLFFFFFFSEQYMQEEEEGATNKKKEKKYRGFQDCTHKNCRKWRQPFWTKMGSLIGLPLTFEASQEGTQARKQEASKS